MGFAAIRTEVRAGFATKAELEALAKSTRATLTGAAAAANETPTGWMIGIMVGARIGGAGVIIAAMKLFRARLRARCPPTAARPDPCADRARP